MGYYIELENISLEQYRSKLEKAYLPPSRSILNERLGERFAYFQKIGIANLVELMQLLKKKDRLLELQKEECLSGDYLKILLRELNSMVPKPNKLKDFPGLPDGVSDSLEKIGIKNTFKLYDRVLTPEKRANLAKETGIDAAKILELTGLCDLSRIKWVGVTYATILYDLGIVSVEKATKADPIELHKQINQLNLERSIFKGHIGLNDVRILVEVAKEVPLEIEY